MNENNSTSVSEDNITLKDIILGFKKYFNEVLRKWWIIALLAMFLSLYFGYKALNTPFTYIANNRFIVESSDGGGVGGLGGLLGSFGFGKQSKTNPFKILEVGLSTAILDQVLLDSLEGTNNIVANEIIERYELDKIWMEKNEKFENFKFATNDKSKWELLDQKAYKNLISFTIGKRRDRSKAIYRIALDEESGIYGINCITIDPNLSYHLSNSIFKRLKDFFENEALQSTYQTKVLLKAKRDSLYAVIENMSRDLSLFEDRNRGSISAATVIKKNKMLTEISGLTSAYQEAFKNYEIVDYRFKDNQPYFMLIEDPLLPLSPTGPSLILNLIIAIILAAFLGSGFIVVRKIYLDALA